MYVPKKRIKLRARRGLKSYVSWLLFLYMAIILKLQIGLPKKTADILGTPLLVSLQNENSISWYHFNNFI